MQGLKQKGEFNYETENGYWNQKFDGEKDDNDDDRTIISDDDGNSSFDADFNSVYYI